MNNEQEPVVGQWYRDNEGHFFEIVASDEDTIEIQYYDGEVEELDLDVWLEMTVTPIDEPGYGSGPFEEVDDEIGLLAEDYRPSSW